MTRFCSALLVCAIALSASYAFADEGKNVPGNPAAKEDPAITKLMNDYMDAVRAMPGAAPPILWCLAKIADQDEKLDPADRALNADLTKLLDEAGAAYSTALLVNAELKPILSDGAALKDPKVREKAAELIAKLRACSDKVAELFNAIGEKVPTSPRVERWEKEANDKK